MNYILICLLAFLLLKKGKFNPAIILPAVNLYKSIPNLSIEDLKNGNFDFTTLAPVIQSFETLVQTASYSSPPSTDGVYETKPLQTVTDFAPKEIVYSIKDYIEE